MRHINIYQEVNVYDQPTQQQSTGNPGLFLLCFVLLPLIVAAIAAVILGAWALDAGLALIAGTIDLIIMAIDGLIAGLAAVSTGAIALVIMATEWAITALPFLGGLAGLGLAAWVVVSLARRFAPLLQRQPRSQYQVVPPAQPTLIVINAGHTLTGEQIIHLLADQGITNIHDIQHLTAWPTSPAIPVPSGRLTLGA